MKKIKSLDLVWITVSDLNKAIKYYTETVGLNLCEKHDEFGWAELSGEQGARLGVAQHSSQCPIRPGQNGIFTLTVDNINEYKKFAQGVTFIGDMIECADGQVKMQLCEDSDKNTFQLVELTK